MKSILLLLLLISSFTYSQQTVELLESTLKLGPSEEKEFYLGFAEGDQVLLDFTVEKGRFVDEFEVLNLDKSVIFSDVKVKAIRNKTIRITNTGIYLFRFTNKSSKDKLTAIHIRRIPKSPETQGFNSTVHWRVIGDTISKEKTEKYLIRKDTAIVELLNEVSKVHSNTNLSSSNQNTIKFKLPKNTVSWAYYIDVDQAGQKDFEKATKELANLAPKVSMIPEIGPVAALALGMTPLLPAIQNGEDVNFYLTDYENVLLFMKGSKFNSLRKGLVINTYGRMEPDPKYTGNYYICLENDNAVTGITVTVKVVAIVVTEEWGTRTINAVVKERKEAHLED